MENATGEKTAVRRKTGRVMRLWAVEMAVSNLHTRPAMCYRSVLLEIIPGNGAISRGLTRHCEHLPPLS